MAYHYLAKQNPGIITHQNQNMATGSLASTSSSGLQIVTPDTIPMTVSTAIELPRNGSSETSHSTRGIRKNYRQIPNYSMNKPNFSSPGLGTLSLSASRSKDSSFDSNYLHQVLADIQCISSLVYGKPPPVFTCDEVTLAVKSLNTNRAPDPHGLMAEHIKHAPPAIIHSMTCLFNDIATMVYVPAEMTCGDIITIPKKNKDPLVMGNHRGDNHHLHHRQNPRTYVLVSRVKDQLSAKQHTLQFGFTEKLSPSMAALICTEVLANNKDKSEDTYVATADVQKAFDSVFHPSLLRKLFIATEADATWPLFSYLLHNIEVKVRIGPLKSKCVTLNQGVGQGRIPSTSQYKLHLDRLLSTLESSGLGSHIGPFYCGAPTCADDVLLVADSHNELQAQLDIIGHYLG